MSTGATPTVPPHIDITSTFGEHVLVAVREKGNSWPRVTGATLIGSFIATMSVLDAIQEPIFKIFLTVSCQNQAVWLDYIAGATCNVDSHIIDWSLIPIFFGNRRTYIMRTIQETHGQQKSLSAMFITCFLWNRSQFMPGCHYMVV